jgi:hypothetical protein
MRNERFQLNLRKSGKSKTRVGFKECIFELYLPEKILEKYERDLGDLKSYPHCIHETIVYIATSRLNEMFASKNGSNIFLEPPKIFGRNREKGFQFKIYFSSKSKIRENEIKRGYERQIEDLLNKNLHELSEEYNKFYEEF